MKVRVGLMGFGRIGRNLARILHSRNDIEIVAISDIADAHSLAYLLKYDTLWGRFPEPVALQDDYLHVGNKKIAIVAGRDPSDVPWDKWQVDVVIEATGRPRSREQASKHLEKGVKRVVMCVPPTETSSADVSVVMGINHQDLNAKHRIVSNASVTAHAALPVIQVIEQAFGIERLFYTAVHAYTGDQRLADVPAPEMRTSRAAAENIIPSAAESPHILATFVPSLRDKIDGTILKVPVQNGSLIDLVTFTKKPITVTAVNDAVRSAAAGRLKGIIEYSTDPIVSSDIIRSQYSSTFDSLATMALGDHAVKTLSWFDNSWGYAHRAIDLVTHLAQMEGGLS